eukprot:3178657-Rhodomonas_salina.2
MASWGMSAGQCHCRDGQLFVVGEGCCLGDAVDEGVSYAVVCPKTGLLGYLAVHQHVGDGLLFFPAQGASRAGGTMPVTLHNGGSGTTALLAMGTKAPRVGAAVERLREKGEPTATLPT